MEAAGGWTWAHWTSCAPWVCSAAQPRALGRVTEASCDGWDGHIRARAAVSGNDFVPFPWGTVWARGRPRSEEAGVSCSAGQQIQVLLCSPGRP